MYLMRNTETVHTNTEIFYSNSQSRMVVEKEFKTLWLIQI